MFTPVRRQGGGEGPPVAADRKHRNHIGVDACTHPPLPHTCSHLRAGKEVEKDPQLLQTGDVAIVEIVPLQPLAVEAFSECAALGRFALRDLQQASSSVTVLGRAHGYFKQARCDSLAG